MLLSAFVAFAVLGWIPWWLAAIVVARDVILLIGAVSYHMVTRQLKMEPLQISKINTFAQIILAVSLIYTQVNPMHPQLLNADGYCSMYYSGKWGALCSGMVQTGGTCCT